MIVNFYNGHYLVKTIDQLLDGFEISINSIVFKTIEYFYVLEKLI